MGKADNWAIVDLSGGWRTGDTGPERGATVELWVDGISLPVAQLSMEYGVNAIPTASAQIALGRDVRTQEESMIYWTVSRIKQMAEVQIAITGKLGDYSTKGDEDGKKQQFPGDATPRIIFMGYVSGLCYRRSMGRVSAVINMVNQLFDLAASSGGCKDMVPGAPHDFMVQTLKTGAGGDGYGSSETQFVFDMPSQLNEDFNNAILSAMDYLSQHNYLQTNNPELWCMGSNLVNPKLESNKAAAKVLASSGSDEGWQGIATFSDSAYMDAYAVKSPLRVHSTGRAKVATVIGNQVSSSMASSNMWGIMVSALLPPFGCGIIPMARGAIVAPILPMSRIHGITIEPSDYVDFNMSMQSQRPLFGVGVLGNYALGTLDPKYSKYCIGGGYTADLDAKDPVNQGMWLFVSAPAWLDDFSNSDPLGMTQSATNTMLNQVSPSAVSTNPPVISREGAEETEAWNACMQQYAQMMYSAQALYGRQGTLVGKLRFDIAPGTTVRIRTRGDQLSDGTDNLAEDMFGFVARVTIMINAEQTSAATSFEITQLRTATENESDRFAMDSHPFFGSQFFVHAPLVPELSML